MIKRIPRLRSVDLQYGQARTVRGNSPRDARTMAI
ncbi:hypothetical protein FHR81_002045 [Actinoalloteichus hoggarensis]|uniref:Uncharacterized protein n=1 Tax=Actinoalloteichus hoggarensis TaxID=1470176 RepID=A0A221W6R2_9PSEU|nr:hypothetical protein AHOG_17260 [Actinoalloteichus hoggarensis]MBB5921007.1 hypothetical protein [Actinoalloteichus hoggarensis]